MTTTDPTAALAALAATVKTKKAKPATATPVAPQGGSTMAREDPIPNVATHQSCKMRLFEYTGGNSNKYYEVYLVESGMSQWVLKHYGRIGASGQWQCTAFPSGGAQRAYDDECRKRVEQRGYTAVNDNSWARVPMDVALQITKGDAGALGRTEVVDGTMILAAILQVQKHLFDTGGIDVGRLTLAREQVKALNQIATEATETLQITEKLMARYA